MQRDALHISDEKIIKGLRDDYTREQAFRWLLQKYQERLYWHIRRMVTEHDDANDVIQNTLLKVFRSIHNFKGQSKLYTWLYRIATNEAITFLNQRKRRMASSMDDEDINLNNRLKADSYFDGNEAQRLLKSAIATLPEKQRLVFNMRYYDGMSYNDIAAILGTSVGGLKASYHHAAKKIEHFVKTASQ